VSDRVFLSYDPSEDELAAEVTRFANRLGLAVSGRRSNREGEHLLTDLFQQLQASRVTLVLLTPESSESEYIKREIAWSLENAKGIVGLRLDPAAGVPAELFESGAEVLDWWDKEDLDYLPPAIELAQRGARVLELAAQRGTGAGAHCARPAKER
jgi:hypothetical protein